MAYMILDQAGNAVESFDSERDALDALIRFAEQDPEAPRSLAILAFDDEGEAVGEVVTVADISPELATTLTLRDEVWTQSRLTVRRNWSWSPGSDPWATLGDTHLATS